MANPTGPSPSDAAMTVLIYVDINKRLAIPTTSRCSQTADAAEIWFTENDPAFENPVIG
jgi:hypothetical protein